VKCHFHEHFEAIGVGLQGSKRFALAEHAPPCSKLRLGRQHDAPERRDDLHEVNRRRQDVKAIIGVEREMCRLDRRMRDFEGLLEVALRERDLVCADADRGERSDDRRTGQNREQRTGTWNGEPGTGNVR
jgi:hypothetical protein